jgi:carboxyl-terminal processing protease
MIKRLPLSLVLLLAANLASAQSLVGWVKSKTEAPDAGRGTRVFASDFKQVPNPDFKDPSRVPPPNLTDAQIQKLIGLMVKAEMATLPPGTSPRKATLRQEQAMRLVANCVIIDSNYVDDIPAAVWDKAIADMGETASKEFPKKKNWDETINEMIKTGAGKMLDPFSVYWTSEEFKRFNDSMNNSFVGVGVILAKDGSIDIVIPGGPADKAGVKAGDKIKAVDGTPVDSAESVMKKTLGKEGTPVVMTLERAGKALPPLTIVRGQVTTRNVFSKMAGPEVGYVYLGQFSPDSDKEIVAAVGRLKDAGAKKMILDVRGNPGGTVDSVSNILSEFMKDRQTIVSFKKKGQVMYTNVADGNGRFLGMPLVILVNGGSASASEILAGAVQDVLGPSIVGSRTYGKGSMQSIMPDRQGRALKLTIGRWYTPRDRNIDAKYDPKTHEKIKDSGGVIPDHLIVLTEEQEKAIMQQLFREVQGARPTGTPVADPVLAKGLEILAGK